MDAVNVSETILVDVPSVLLTARPSTVFARVCQTYEQFQFFFYVAFAQFIYVYSFYTSGLILRRR